MSSEFWIVGFNECPWCEKAKSLLEQQDIVFHYTEIPSLTDRAAWMDNNGFRGADRTFPKVYVIDGSLNYIGGYKDLEEWLFIDNEIV